MALTEMCNDPPMEYRYSVGKRVGDSLVGVTWALGSAFAIGTSVIVLVDPGAVGSTGWTVTLSVTFRPSRHIPVIR
jgi:hypothetical protein